MGPLLNAAFEFIERTAIGLVKVGKHFFILDSLNSEKTLTDRLYFQLTPHRYLARDGTHGVGNIRVFRNNRSYAQQIAGLGNKKYSRRTNPD